ncbi:MAG: tetratricopeptide repeat protein [Methanomassiliicoccales archaeon]|nr:tetratricopeptide repeat protein [Methanomassiliicoccales archaeon]
MSERIEVGSKGNPNFIEVRHGKMLISVPRSIFRSGTSSLRREEAEEFKEVLASRYPWLSHRAREVVLEEAQQTMESILEMERGAVGNARKLFEEGRYARALGLLEGYLAEHPKDPDAWYLKGEIHFKLGKREEGFGDFARARGHSGKSEEVKRKGR